MGVRVRVRVRVTKWETKSLKIKNARHTHITSEKNMKGLVGGPLLVRGLGPAGTPLKSSPAITTLKRKELEILNGTEHSNTALGL